MRLILQRVSSAAVRVGEETVGETARGVLALVGVEKGDGPPQAEAAAAKLATLRLFEDDQGRMNLDARASGAAFLVVSQFTLAGNPLNKGRRPSFTEAAPPAEAEPLVGQIVDHLRREGFEVATGRFGASMQVALVNDGPVTFVLDIRP